MPEANDYMTETQTLPIKVSILGESGASRHRILQMVARGSVWDTYDPVNQGEYRKTLYERKGAAILEFSMLIDVVTPGEKAFHERLVWNGDVFLFVYHVTSRRTFDFIKSLHSNIFRPRDSGKPAWVCAVGVDKPQTTWEVPLQEGREFSRKVGAHFRPVPAKRDSGLGPDFVKEIVKTIPLARAPHLAAEEKIHENPAEGVERKRNRLSMAVMREKLTKFLHAKHV